MAMPRHWPIWRLVEAMPEATPACETGIPDTAVYVIGAFTMPPPMPNTANATASGTVAEVTVSRDSSTHPRGQPQARREHGQPGAAAG